MPTLLALFGPKRGLRLDVAAPLVVGRAPAAGLQLLDGTVSREHCRFEVAPDGGLQVVDLGSQNGTFVNGERLDGGRALISGDEVCIGDTLWVVDPDLDLAASTWGETFLLAAPSAPTQLRAAFEEPGGEQPVEALVAAMREIAAASTVEERAERLLVMAIRLAGAERAMLLRSDGSGGALHPIAGSSPDEIFPLSPELARQAVERGGAVCADQTRPAALRSGRALTSAGIDTVLVAPALVPGGARGLLCVSTRGRRAYSRAVAGQIEVLAAFADGAGLFERPAPTGASTRPSREPLRDVEPVAESPAFRAVIDTSRRLAAVPATVLVVGESGTGKEAIARFIHTAGPRAGAPFVAVNCGAVPESLAESEFFGSERGAFTGAARSRPGWIEAADGGTLFLDEIGELAPAIQAKLLRVIEERAVCRVGSTAPRRVDVRIVAATHRDLEADVRAGRFRQDLLYRLDVVRLQLPPLRERPEDLGPLAHGLVARIARRLGVRAPSLAPEAVMALHRHDWPGNVRELGNVLERALVLGAAVGRGSIGAPDILAALPPGGGSIGGADGGTLVDKIAALERTEIEAALRRARGVKARAAEALGISRPTLDKKIAQLGIDLFPEAS